MKEERVLLSLVNLLLLIGFMRRYFVFRKKGTLFSIAGLVLGIISLNLMKNIYTIFDVMGCIGYELFILGLIIEAIVEGRINQDSGSKTSFKDKVIDKDSSSKRSTRQQRVLSKSFGLFLGIVGTIIGLWLFFFRASMFMGKCIYLTIIINSLFILFWSLLYGISIKGKEDKVK